MYDIKTIKDRISCLEYAQMNGLQVQRSGDRCKSPLRPEAKNDSSFVVYTDHYYDYGDSSFGDVIDLCALWKHNGDKGLAISELASITGVKYDDGQYAQWKQATQKRCNEIQTWHEDLRMQDYEYLYSRGITSETIKRLRIGYNNKRIVVPYYKGTDSYVFSWVARATEPDQKPKYLKPKNNEFTESFAWGMHTLDRQCECIYIAEGAFDALSIDQSGFPVLATMGGHFSKDTLKSVINICKNYRKAILTFDNDKSGLEFTQKLGTVLFKNRILFDVALIQKPNKDISDYYAAGGQIKDLPLVNGLHYMAKSITGKEEFSRFVYEAARYHDKADIAELFEYLQTQEDCKFSAAWLKEINKQSYKPPTDIAVAEEILSAHTLAYVNGAGFYEYINGKGKWQRQSDIVIHGYILDTLGTFASGARLNPILNTIKPLILTEDVFNQKPVVSFTNGTLELETGVFRENDKSDYCSIQMAYPYNEEAKCTRWKKFISEIMQYDEKKIDLLQEIAGYALVSDCRYEKIFVLTGEGGNGKSIYTKILQQVFGEENISNITPKGLTEPFQLVHLRDALLNIAGEIKSDVSGAEETMKQIASGEMLKACYKGKDFISFKPRAKMIFACNGQLQSRDTSDGLKRRLIIVDFPCKYVDDPDPTEPLEFKRDINLEPKLLKEIQGIFNWAYDGYKMMKNTGYITEPDEHKQLMKEFDIASNPIVSFFDDFLDTGIRTITNKDLYYKYSRWCEETNHKPFANNRFSKEFKRVSRKYFETYERSTRTNLTVIKERGFTKIENNV